MDQREIQREIQLSEAYSTFSTLLECDIKPGALFQRYSVRWIRVPSNLTTLATNKFNVTLVVSSRSNGSKYQCEVTVDHDGDVSAVYKGRVNFIIVKGVLRY